MEQIASEPVTTVSPATPLPRQEPNHLVHSDGDTSVDPPGSQSEDSTEDPITPKKSARMKRAIDAVRQRALSWLLLLVTLTLVGYTLSLARRIANVQTYYGTFYNYTFSIRVLRVLAEVNTILLTTLVSMSSRIAVFAASSSKRGVSMSTWLAMSPTTSFLGLCKLLNWRSQQKQGYSRLASLLNHFTICSISFEILPKVSFTLRYSRDICAVDK
jgi:hypothetical protein